MKILSLNFVKTESVPVRTRNTETQKMVAEIIAALGKVPSGQSLSFTASGAKQYHRYQLQRKLQVALKSKTLAVVQEGDKFFVTR